MTYDLSSSIGTFMYSNSGKMVATGVLKLIFDRAVSRKHVYEYRVGGPSVVASYEMTPEEAYIVVSGIIKDLDADITTSYNIPTIEVPEVPEDAVI